MHWMPKPRNIDWYPFPPGPAPSRDTGADPGCTSGASFQVGAARTMTRVGPADERSPLPYVLLREAAVRAAGAPCALTCSPAGVPICDPRAPGLGALDPSNCVALRSVCYSYSRVVTEGTLRETAALLFGPTEAVRGYLLHLRPRLAVMDRLFPNRRCRFRTIWGRRGVRRSWLRR